jgi:cytochrome c-type biogenesis protein
VTELGADLSSQVWLAFAAGLLSVLSPCVLPLMPAYLSLLSGISVEQLEAGAGDRELRARVMRACVGFVTGFSLVFILFGVGAVTAGRALRSWRVDLFGLELGISQLAGLLVILLGLHLSGLTPIRALYRDARFDFSVGRRSFASSLAVGAGFAFGWSPCIGPILAAILTVAGSRETLVQGVLLLSVYSAGLAVPFLLAGFSMQFFSAAFRRIRRYFRALEIASGAVLVGVGLLLATNQLTALNGRFRGLTEWLAAAERALQ